MNLAPLRWGYHHLEHTLEVKWTLSEHFGEIASDRPDQGGKYTMGWHNEYWKHIYRENKIQPYKYLGHKTVDKRTQKEKEMLNVLKL